MHRGLLPENSVKPLSDILKISQKDLRKRFRIIDSIVNSQKEKKFSLLDLIKEISSSNLKSLSKEELDKLIEIYNAINVNISRQTLFSLLQDIRR